MQTAVDAWKDNLQKQVKQVSALLLRYMTLKDDEIATELNDRINGLKSMFADERVPPELTKLEIHLQQYRPNTNNPKHFQPLIQSYEALPSIATFDEEPLSSFDEIFESYKDDERLSELVDDLVGLLERIISEGDAILTAQVSRELKQILKELKRRNRYSLYELQSWVDIGMKSVIKVIESNTGMEGLELFYEAAKVSFQIKKNMMKSYDEAQMKLIEIHELKHTKQALLNITEITTEADLEAHLLSLPAPDDSGEQDADDQADAVAG